MSWEVYKALVDDLKSFGVMSLAFEGGGEPLMNPQLGKFIKYAKDEGLGVGVLTNGTKYIDELLLADWVRISLDVPTEDIFNEIKRPPNRQTWQRTIDNIRGLVANKKGTTVGLKFMLSRWWTDRDA
jgi:wyosine [tRNA(Phe)-imidazoG37] synthetase (radical SAM superfamily)